MTNNVTIDGRLAEDPALRFTQTGKAVANLRIGHTPRTFDKQTNEFKDGETLWDNVTIWGKGAELVAETMGKGDLVLVSGRRKSRSFESNGQQRTVVEIEADSVALVRKKNKAAASPAYQGDDPWAAEAPTDSPAAPF